MLNVVKRSWKFQKNEGCFLPTFVNTMKMYESWSNFVQNFNESSQCLAKVFLANTFGFNEILLHFV
jgi:hypothetical protein